MSMKRVLITIALCLFIGSNICFADETSILTDGIQAYKNGYYELWKTKMKEVVKDDPS